MPLSVLCNEGTLEVRQCGWRMGSAWPNNNLVCLYVREAGHWKWKNFRGKNVFFLKYIPCGKDSTVGPLWGQSAWTDLKWGILKAKVGRGIVAVALLIGSRALNPINCSLLQSALRSSTSRVKTGPTPCLVCASPERRAEWHAEGGCRGWCLSVLSAGHS